MAIFFKIHGEGQPFFQDDNFTFDYLKHFLWQIIYMMQLL